jgi:hypothetical protein
MDSHSTHCANCHYHVTVTPSQIVMYGVRWACPACGYVIDFSQKQLAKPGLSQQAKEFWGLVGVAAFFIGLIKLADRLSA